MNKPETSLEFVVSWFQKARDSAKAQGKADSAALWADGLSHLKWQAAELDRLQARVAELEVDAERLIGLSKLTWWVGDWDTYNDTLVSGENHNTSIEALRAAIDTARKDKP